MRWFVVIRISFTEGLAESLPPDLRDDCEFRLTALIESGRVNTRTIGLALAHAAMNGYQQGRADGVGELLTTQQVAEQLGIDGSQVRRLARARGVGWLIGMDRLFRPEDVERLRERNTKRGPRARAGGGMVG